MREQAGSTVTQLTPAEVVGRAALVLVKSVRPFVEGHSPGGTSERTWADVYHDKDRLNGVGQRRYSLDDPRFLLKILVQEWRHFDHRVNRAAGGYARELLETLNQVAHSPGAITVPAAARAIDTCRLLLRSLHLHTIGLAELEELMRGLYAGVTQAPPAPEVLPSDANDEGFSPIGSALPVSTADEGTVEGSSEDPVPVATDDPIEDLDVEPVGDVVLEDGLRRIVLRHGAVTLAVTSRESVSYALLTNGIGPIVEVVAHNGSDQPVTVSNLSIAIDLGTRGPNPLQGPPLAIPPLRVSPGSETRLSPAQLALPLQHNAFADLDEATSALLQVEATLAGERRVGVVPIRLLAHDEWSGRSIPELLAAFITPNDAALQPLLDTVTEHIRSATGNPALDGYQGGHERARSLAAAVYAAIAASGITYSVEQASFEIDGQKVRSVADALDQRRGTCLDLVVLYCSLAEAVGLHPVVIHVPNHALAGVLVTDGQLSDVAVSDQAMLHNLSRSGFLVPLEITAAADPSGIDFKEAVRRGEQWFREPQAAGGPALDHIIHVLDVTSAHRRVRPLPRRRVDVNGIAVVEIERPTGHVMPVYAEPSRRICEALGPVRPPRIERWRNSLLDLSLRNPLLKLRATSGIVLGIDERGLVELEDALHLGQRFQLKSAADIGELEVARGLSSALELDPEIQRQIMRNEHTLYVDTRSTQHADRLDRLRRDAQLTTEETGANNLFLTLGALKWPDGNGNDARAPLFLLPMKLVGNRKTSHHMSIAEGAEVLPNYCLIEKLRRDLGLEIPALENPPHDAAGIDLARVFQEIRTALIERRVSYTVEPHARLALLQFATLEMWRDVSDNWERLMGSPVVRHLVESPLESFVDQAPAPELTAADEATACLPVAVDGAQLAAIRWATAGRTFILEGPPGTGKSQTITNMIADCLAAGRTVLFVAEKQAALDVVRRRLDDVGIGRLTLDLHGRQQSVSSLRAQLRDSWEADTSATSATLTEQRSQLGDLIRTLDSYPAAVHEAGPAGISAWDAHAKLSDLEAAWPTEAFANLHYPVPATVFQSDGTVRAARAALVRLVSSLDTLRRTPNRQAWTLVGLGAQPTPTELGLLAGKLRVSLEGLDPAVAAVLTSCTSTTWDALAEWSEKVERGDAIRPSDVNRCIGPIFDSRRRQLLEEAAQHQARFAELLAITTPSTANIRIDQVRSAIAEADKRSVFTRRKVRKGVVHDVVSRLASPDATSWKALPRVLDDLEQYRADVDRLTTAILELVPGGVERGSPSGLRTLHDRVTSMVDATRQIVETTDQTDALDILWVAARDRSHGSFPAKILSFTRAWQGIRRLLDATEATEERWLDGETLLHRLKACLPIWESAAARGRLTEVDRTRAVAGEVQHLQVMGLGPVVDDAFDSNVVPDHVLHRFLYRVAAERLAERLATTNLDAIDPVGRSRDVDRYRSTSTDVRTAMGSHVIAQARRSRGFDRSKPNPEQAALLKWAQRARGSSIRQGITQHGAAMLQVTPCFMMSPSSVARHLPVGDPGFDVVIFDEASQIKVADAIGALGRGRSAVIVGDSKQMPPSSMFDVGVADDDIADEGDEIVTPADQESILSEAVTSNIEALALTWHYRSRNETLIAFSNAEYYEGKLASFPSPPEPATGRGISVRHVDGVFDRGSRSAQRVNAEEANAIAAEITRRLTIDRQASIGVVTFNVPQRDFIADLLEGSANSAVRAALARDHEPVFVKNLENVQGDERDVILFSLAFSPDPKTKRMSLNFGPVTRHGGERRLNVAITRARAEILLFTSFRPEDIDLGRTSSVGMSHLRKYLAFAQDVAHGAQERGSTTSVDPHRSQIARALVAAGLEVKEDLGLSAFRVDLAIRRPGYRWVAVVLDGPTWKNRRIVADRDGIPGQALARMGWNDTVHVLLSEWVADRESVIRRLVSAAETSPDHSPEQTDGVHEQPARIPLLSLAPAMPESAAPDQATLPTPLEQPESLPAVVSTQPPGRPPVRLAVPGTAQPSATGPPQAPTPTDAGPAWSRIARATPAASIDPVVPSSPPRLPRREPFRGADRTPRLDRYHLEHWYERASKARVRSEIRAVIDVEAPIGSRRLAQVVGNRCGFQRLYENRESDILRLVDADLIRQDLGRLGEWYWTPDADPEAYDLFRHGPVHDRTIQDVPPIEALNAMRWVLSTDGALHAEDLLRQSNRALGANRFGAGIREHLDNVLKWALSGGRLESHDGEVHIPVMRL